MGKTVSFRQQQGVGIVTIDNPPVNAFSQQVRADLLNLLTELAAQDGLDAILLVGAGRTFVAGADINEFEHAEIPPPDYNEVQEFIERFALPIVAVLDRKSTRLNSSHVA